MSDNHEHDANDSLAWVEFTAQHAQSLMSPTADPHILAGTSSFVCSCGHSGVLIASRDGGLVVITELTPTDAVAYAAEIIKAAHRADPTLKGTMN